MKRILLVEDDPNIAGVIKSLIASPVFIRESKFDLVHVPTGTEALRLFEAQPHDKVDGLLVGRYNPDDDGLRIISMYSVRYPDALIALFTGEPNIAYLNSAAVFGANTLIRKPIIFHELRAFFLKVHQKNTTVVPSIAPLIV
ncbi:MAG: response regulator transcription factor [Candidatus Taylorbacteria bacterium]|nr:response regulator transcription factor [Candidatus Taylorbacteria bacterium]